MNVKLKLSKRDVVFQLNFSEFGENQAKGFLVAYGALVLFALSPFVFPGFLLFVEPFLFLVCLARDKGGKTPFKRFFARYAYIGFSNGLVLVLPGLIVLSLAIAAVNEGAGGIISPSMKKFFMVVWYLLAQGRRLSIHSEMAMGSKTPARSESRDARQEGLLDALGKISAVIGEELQNSTATNHQKLADKVSDLMMNTGQLRCPKCGHEIDAAMNFCIGCGAPIQTLLPGGAVCAKCGSNIPAGAGYCPRCHHPVGLIPREQRKQGEKKRATVSLTDRAAVEQTIAALSNASLGNQEREREEFEQQKTEKREQAVAAMEKEYRKSQAEAQAEYLQKREENQRLTESAKNIAYENLERAKEELVLAQKRQQVVSTPALPEAEATLVEIGWNRPDSPRGPEVMRAPEVMNTPLRPTAEPLEQQPFQMEKPLPSRPPETMEGEDSASADYQSSEMTRSVRTATPTYTAPTGLTTRSLSLTSPTLTAAPGFETTKPPGADFFDKPVLSAPAVDLSPSPGEISFAGDRRTEQVCMACRHLDHGSGTCKKDVLPVSETYCWHQNKA